jgi:hypothetical protein
VNSEPQQTKSLSEALAGKGIANLSPIACVILMACIFGRNLTHLHRPGPQDNDHDVNGDFWKRHRAHDNVLLCVSMSLPSHLRLPQGINDPNTIFCNMGIHASAICLHQAAIFKAEKNQMPQIIADSKRRCFVAANQISNIMKMACHTDISVVSSISSTFFFNALMYYR